MSTSRGYYECRRVYGAFKCRSGNLFLRQPGVEGFPTFPEGLLPRHYWGLKLKTGKKGGGRVVEPPEATLFPARRFSAAPGSRGFAPPPAPLTGAPGSRLPCPEHRKLLQP